ncbi:M14 family murein peptide amidase A [Magnetococcales bacterium HHB-1]
MARYFPAAVERIPEAYLLLLVIICFNISTVAASSELREDFKQKRSVASLCKKIGSKLGSVSIKECLSHNMVASGGVSVKGSPILIKEYGPVGGRKPQARILLFGGIHGDEYASVSVIFKWMKTLNRHHSGLFHWLVMPLTNPDGLLRKESQRMNHRGVDLNRNFPTDDWLKQSQDYWINKMRKDPRRYPGPAALSEPESRWIAWLIHWFKPHVIVSVHAPYGLLDFDGPPASPPKKLGHLYLDPMGTYPGSLGRYGGITKNIPVITIELTYAGIMPTKKEIRQIWVDMVRWLVKNTKDTQPAPAPLSFPRKTPRTLP